MAHTKKIVYDTSTGVVSIHGIMHNKDGIMAQAMDGVAYDDALCAFRFRDDAFNKEWLAHNKITLVVRQ